MSKKAPKTAARELTTIVAEIRETYRNDSANVIKRGDLLIEAKTQLKHGQWLSWLDNNFSMDARTAQRAMSAAKFATKYDSVSYLNLSIEALYELSSGLRSFAPCGMLLGEWSDHAGNITAAAMAEAKTKPIDSGRLWEIMESMRGLWEVESASAITDVEINETEAEREREAEEEQAEAYRILDGPPPDLPEPPPTKLVPLNSHTPPAALADFDNAIAELLRLRTKPLSDFAGSRHSDDDLKRVAAFLDDLLLKKTAKRLPANVKVNGQPVSTADFSPAAQAQIANAIAPQSAA